MLELLGKNKKTKLLRVPASGSFAFTGTADVAVRCGVGTLAAVTARSNDRARALTRARTVALVTLIDLYQKASRHFRG